MRTIVLEVPEPVEGEALCLRLREHIEAHEHAEIVVCDLTEVVTPDAAIIDALARVQLTARRLGRRVLYRSASPTVRALLALAGLEQLLEIEP